MAASALLEQEENLTKGRGGKKSAATMKRTACAESPGISANEITEAYYSPSSAGAELRARTTFAKRKESEKCNRTDLFCARGLRRTRTAPTPSVDWIR